MPADPASHRQLLPTDEFPPMVMPPSFAGNVLNTYYNLKRYVLGYQLPKLTARTLQRPEGLENYLTPFELLFSKLAKPNNPAFPVIDSSLSVVGHVGWVPWSNIYVAYEDTNSGVYQSLQGLLDRGRLAYVLPPGGSFTYYAFAASYRQRSGQNLETYRQFTTETDQTHLLLTGIDGEIVHELAVVGPGSLDSVSMVDMALILSGVGDLAELGLAIGRRGAAGLYRSLLSLGARSVPEAGAKISLDALAKGIIEIDSELEAREVVIEFRSSGKRVMVNIGGTGEVEGAINLNPNLVAPRKNIPNLIKRPAEDVGDIFEGNSVDEIVSNRLPPNTIDWTKVLPGAQRVLRAGGSITIRFQGIGQDAAVILQLFKDLGFKNIQNFQGAALSAIK